MYNGLSESLGGLLEPHLCPPSGADEVGSHGSLSLAVHDEDDGLKLYE